MARPRGSPFLAPVLALQFLTVAPSIIQRAFTPAELGWAVGFFPLVGLLLGGLLAGLDAVLGLVFPASVSTALVLAAWVLLTGALHLDGFLDACDGLLGGSSPEERLRILRDERVGAFAVAGGILLLLTKYTALAAVPGRAAALVILAPGALGMTLAVVAFRARPRLGGHEGQRRLIQRSNHLRRPGRCLGIAGWSAAGVALAGHLGDGASRWDAFPA